MHAKMLISSAGGILSPLILSNFLIDLSAYGFNQCTGGNQMTTSTLQSTTITSLEWTTSSVEGRYDKCLDLLDDVALVKWSFIFSSCFMIIPMTLVAIASFPSMATRIFPRSTNYNIELASKQKTLPTLQTSNMMTYIFVGAISFLACLFTCMVVTVSQFLQTFAVSGLHWTVQFSIYLNTVHNGAVIFGRIIGIPLSHFVSSSLIVAVSLIFGTIGIVIMLLIGLGTASQSALWAAVIIAGIGRSLVTSSLLIWTNQITGLLTPVQSATISIQLCVGIMIGPVVTSAIYSVLGHMAIVYTALVFNLLQYIVFVIVVLIARRLVVKNNDIIFLSYHMLA